MDCTLSSKPISHCFRSEKLDPNLTFADHITSFCDQEKWKCSLDFFPKTQEVSRLDPDRLFQWLKKSKVDKWMGDGDLELLSKQIGDAVKPFFPYIDKLHQVSIPSHIPVENDTPKTPQVLFSKVCKEGEKLKFGLNIGQAVGRGSFVDVYKIPEVVLDLDGTFELSPKALIVHSMDKNDDIVLSNEGYERGIAIIRELFDDEPLPIFLPRRLDKFAGCYVQHYFKTDFLDALIYDPSLPFTDRLQILEDVARYLAHIGEGSASHYDVKPQNIMLFSDEKGHQRGCLIDYNMSCELGDILKTSYKPYSYHDTLSQNIGGLECFPATQATDLCGLAQTLAEVFLPDVNYRTSHKIWLEKPWPVCLNFMIEHYNKNVNRAPRHMEPKDIVELHDMPTPPEGNDSLLSELWVIGKVFGIVEKIFLADSEFAKKFPTQESVRKGDPLRVAEELFDGIDASWVAGELKKLREALLSH